MFVASQIEEQPEQLLHQRHDLLGVYHAQRLITWATRQAKGQSGWRAGQGAEPDIVGVFEHRQGFAAVQLQGELGRQAMQRRGGLQQLEQRGGQRAGVEQGLRIKGRRRG